MKKPSQVTLSMVANQQEHWAINAGKTGRFPPAGCDAGRLYFSVSPNGQMTICHRTSHNYTHILDPNFEKFFWSKEYERQRMMEAGSCEGCMRACWIE